MCTNNQVPIIDNIERRIKIVIRDDRLDIVEKRNYQVVKANEIVQKARYELNITELKVLAFLISQIKPNDKPMLEYTFTIIDYCKVCGIDYRNGGNYRQVKDTLKGLRDKSIWVKQPDGSEVTVGWLGKARINKGSGKVSVMFDPDLQKYITELYGNYTQYELFCTLPMSSSYSFRIYELLKSYQFKQKQYSHTFDIESLKAQLNAPYHNFKDFRRKVLEISTREINLYTDLEISWEPITAGRKVVEVRFDIQQRDSFGRLETIANTEFELDGQARLMNI